MIIADAKLYVVFDEQCICIKADGSSELTKDLECNQEEAYIRMLLHAQHICHSTENVTILAPETDVLVIAMAISTKISGNLYIRNKSNACIISAEKVKQSLMLRYDLQDTELLSKSLLSFYAFAGSDSI